MKNKPRNFVAKHSAMNKASVHKDKTAHKREKIRVEDLHEEVTELNYNFVYKSYMGSVQYDHHAYFYHGKLDLVNNDLVTYEGNTFEELKQAFKEAVKDYIETKMQMR